MVLRKTAFLAALAVGVAATFLMPAVTLDVAHAAPAARYRVGMKVRAKRNCSVNGFQVKKGVVMNVAAVRSDDKARVVSVDLSFNGMNISDVPVRTMDSLFAPA